jgi:hypothetical protein
MKLGIRRHKPIPERGLHIVGDDLVVDPEDTEYALAYRGISRITNESRARECSGTVIGQTAVRLALEAGAADNPEALRRELAIHLIDIANALDSLDHRLFGQTAVQDDCQAVRGLARSFGAEEQV